MGGISALISMICMIAVSSINIGESAPALEGIQWLKGNAAIFKDHITVVEIWRSSCGHCKAQIPHLTSLQKKYGDRIQIVALSREPVETLEEFIKTNGDQIGYTVGKGPKDLMDAYMIGVQGVPYAYLINRDGLIVWSGKPSEIDVILEKTVEGKVDIEHLKNISLLEASLLSAVNSNDLDTVASIDQKLLLSDPGNEQGLDVGLRLAKYNNEPEKVKEMFDKVQIEGMESAKAISLAMMLITDGDLAYRYPESALKFAIYALKKEPENDDYMDAYARLLYCLGDIEDAIVWEKKALALNTSDSSYQDNLEYYMKIKNIRAKGSYNPFSQSQDQKTAK
jgi:thiol-disulfide isomerase/thioredoxin